ncbi:hypothetical protein F511_31585 [Dorcoceras hygrometricum]|uniref:Uncharacterized protein n=1 Tax=Dorcoceras hygrometricum TaxID=472368 RepID=A0A2Z7A8C4_9LAMI|nr:hypothetical protein F511_31585 [Dorcoceras hygrometricum]
MESCLISNTIQVYFASILEIENEGTVAMFEALISFGLSGFLGCLLVIYEAALIEFFQNSSVRNGRVFSTVRGKPVEISEEVFAETFELPMDGLMDMHEVPKDLVFDARSEFSFDGEQLNTSCKKRELKIVFRLLSDILAKSVTVKAGSFDTVTHERFLMMSAINEGVQSIGAYCCLTFSRAWSCLGPGKPEAMRYRFAVSKKRPTANVDEPTVKRKRTLVGKAAVVEKESALVTVAQEAIPLQLIEPTSVVPAEQPSAPKRKAPKRKFRMPASSDDEIVEKRAAVEDVVEKERDTSVDNLTTRRMVANDPSREMRVRYCRSPSHPVVAKTTTFPPRATVMLTRVYISLDWTTSRHMRPDLTLNATPNEAAPTYSTTPYPTRYKFTLRQLLIFTNATDLSNMTAFHYATSFHQN